MINFENVSKVYSNGTHALHDISINIEKGEFVFIVGASGAGKSTFLKLIMREETPTSGEITINGNKLSRLRKRDVPYLRRHMGVVFQDFRLIDKMNVFDNVAFAMRAVGESSATIKKRVPYVLDLVGLKYKAKDKPSELSGGEQQRVSLARALVNNPEIIVADEPTGNIDPELSHEIIELLTQINGMGTTVLVVTHEHELVREFNHRVITIDRGEVVSDSSDPTVTSTLPDAPAPVVPAVAPAEDELQGYAEEYSEDMGEAYAQPEAEAYPAEYDPQRDAQYEEQYEAEDFTSAPAPQVPVVPVQPVVEEDDGVIDISSFSTAGLAAEGDAPRYPDNAVKRPD